jgi:spore coat protein U-like protein
MQSGANILPYNIYKDPARSMIWGDGAGGYSGLVITNTFSLLSWTSSVNLYGRIPASMTSRPGNYSDTILVTVEW